MTWRRCDRTRFYASLEGQLRQHHEYIDPVDIVVVQAMRRGAYWHVYRQVIEDFQPQLALQSFGRTDASILLKWRLRVMNSALEATDDSWREELYQDLDIDPELRDHLLDLLSAFMVRTVQLDPVMVPTESFRIKPTREALEEALARYGIEGCA